MAVLMTLDDPEYALLRDHRLADQRRRRLAPFGRNIAQALHARGAGTQVAQPMRHRPDAVLVRNQDATVPPGEAIGCVEPFGVALDPFGPAVSVPVAQQRQVAHALLGHDHVAVRQHQQTPGCVSPPANKLTLKPSGTRGT